MTDEQIIKALECCISNQRCDNCPLYASDSCFVVEEKAIYDLINRKNAELKKKDTEINILIRKNNTLKDEISRLQNILVGFMSEVGTWSNKYDVDVSNIHKIPLLAKEDFSIRNKIKLKGIKEFWEALKTKKQWDVDIPEYVFVSDGDNLVEEMTK